MQRVSTNLTLFFKFFIPTFWIVFFGAFTAAAFVFKTEYYGDIPGGSFRLGTVLFFLSGVVVFVFTIMRLKRVEMDEHFVYATDYFRNFRYPYHNVEKIDESKFLFFQTVTIYLKTPGTFGKYIWFIASNSRYKAFWEKHPELRKSLLAS